MKGVMKRPAVVRDGDGNEAEKGEERGEVEKWYVTWGIEFDKGREGTGEVKTLHPLNESYDGDCAARGLALHRTLHGQSGAHWANTATFNAPMQLPLYLH